MTTISEWLLTSQNRYKWINSKETAQANLNDFLLLSNCEPTENYSVLVSWLLAFGILLFDSLCPGAEAK